MSITKKHVLAFISILSFTAGTLFFCCYQEWLIVYWNRPHASTTTTGVQKKKISLLREKNSAWVKESADVLWSDNEPENLKKLTTEWVTWLEDEHVLEKKVSVESVLFSPSGYEVYLSLDQNPFGKGWSIHQKASFVKAFLKTYRENGCTASHLYFLVHHEPLQDVHLDFNEPWSIVSSGSD